MSATRNRTGIAALSMMLLAGAPASGDDCLTNTPVGVASVPTQGVAVEVVDGYAYICDTGTGLRIFDLVDETDPVEVGFYETPGLANEIVVQDGVAYIADFFDGLRIVDVSDPTNPVSIGSVNTPDRALGVAVHGTTAYVADNSNGVIIYDVSVPSAPVELGSFDTPGRALSVRILDQGFGTIAVVADGIAGVRFVDVSDPADPQFVQVIDTPGVATAVDFRPEEPVFYVADDIGGVHIIDNSFGAAFFLTTVATPGPAVDVRYSPHRPENLFVAMRDAGAAVLTANVTCFGLGEPRGEGEGGCFLNENAMFAGTYNGTALAESIWLDTPAERMYVSAASDGVHIVDTTFCFNCPGDFNVDGVVNILDVVALIMAWQGGLDWNNDGNVNILDVVDFISLWQLGCK